MYILLEIRKYWVLVVSFQYINFIGNKEVLGSSGQPSINFIRNKEVLVLVVNLHYINFTGNRK